MIFDWLLDGFRWRYVFRCGVWFGRKRERLRWILIGSELEGVSVTVKPSNPQEGPLLLGFTGFYWLFHSFTRFYWVLLRFTGFHWVLLGFTGFYWVLLGFADFYLDFLFFNWVFELHSWTWMNFNQIETKIMSNSSAKATATAEKVSPPFSFLFLFFSVPRIERRKRNRKEKKMRFFCNSIIKEPVFLLELWRFGVRSIRSKNVDLIFSRHLAPISKVSTDSFLNDKNISMKKKEERIFFSFKRKPVHRRTSRDPQLFFIDFLLFLSFSFPTGFYRVLSSVFILIRVGFTEFQRVSSGSYWITLDDIKLKTSLRTLPSLWLRYRVLPSFYWILIAFTEFFILIWVGFYRVSKGFERFLLDYIGFHQTNDVPLGLTVALIALPSFT